ncbi:helix-hairpin-helix domain-containing protein [Streptoalloteichus hindustanus]|uniref:Helix-hairpin-helix domain-containing protein n=1 Tax=Streptoalloteichus hindustanus TaxID=2017 RepID=A0A1M4XNX6_STRHI|nr:hypothetical protein [Streptoalloteichus hindustanus]SHE95148.1 hypothetical protein SAMN05444320_10266 [Streptoalloteichus hindustanus]
MPPQDSPVPTEYPQSIGRTARRVLALNGYTRYDQLTTVTTAELLKIHGVGPKAVRILREELASRGLNFADS